MVGITATSKSRLARVFRVCFLGVRSVGKNLVPSDLEYEDDNEDGDLYVGA